MAVNSPNPPPVDYMNRGLRVRDLAGRLSLAVRKEHFQLFIDNLAPDSTTTILDIGVSPANDLIEANFFEKLYPDTQNITAASVEDASNLEQDFPGLSFVQLDEGRLPFEDGQFDIAFSSAVLEHVGDRAHQRAFIAEMVRVSRRVFLTTPNRWFPIELHTALPFLHWLPQPRHQALLARLKHEQWASTDNLNLLGARDLYNLFPPGVDFVIHKHRLAGLCSNLIAWSLPA